MSNPLPTGTNISESWSICEYCNLITNEWYDARSIVEENASYYVVLNGWKIMCPECSLRHSIDVEGLSIHHLSMTGYSVT